ncbi:carboxylesterase/lipase family protein [Burkholderia pyrrocinia]|nr:carboxylesterase family protein [Burkholderia pyrrocinia]
MTGTILAQCDQGSLEGVTVDRVHTFYDIPYASDSGRFRPAGASVSWTGVRDCTRPGVVFPQMPSRLDFVMGPTSRGVEQSEDAFRLNIYTPGLEGNLPVIFWIHGGGFMTGGALGCYSGESIARTGRAVVVTMNYRLGVLGNLCMEGVSPGNLCVSDLELALRWVRTNIARFGGDPESIVAAGQSAGAWYSQLLAAMPTTHPLLNGIAMLSYPGIQPMKPAKAHALAVRMCESAGLVHTGEALATLPVERILQMQFETVMASAEFAEIPIAFMPVATGGVPADPGAAAQQHFRGKPVLIGWTRDETGSFFAGNPQALTATDEQALNKFRLEFGDAGEARYESVADDRFDRKPYAALVALSSEKLFESPGRRFAQGMTEAGSNVFAYRFDFPSPQPNVGACHCFELPFFFNNFGNWIDAPMLDGIDEKRSRELSKRIQAYFLNFVESGNPNGAELPRWNAFSDDGGGLMHWN